VDTNVPPSAQERLARAAADAKGVGDRSAPFLLALARAEQAAAEREARDDARAASLRADLREAVRRVEQNTAKPALTDTQVRDSVVPVMTAGASWGKAIIGALLLGAAFVAGDMYRASTEPVMTCGDWWSYQDGSRQAICWYPYGDRMRPTPPPPPPQELAAPPTAPTPQAGPKPRR
jgi:hypothetical protein